ncbi:hypothetical protein Plhal304r1_c014g0053541 [Plasmopara halstedii]
MSIQNYRRQQRHLLSSTYKSEGCRAHRESRALYVDASNLNRASYRHAQRQSVALPSLHEMNSIVLHRIRSFLKCAWSLALRPCEKMTAGSLSLIGEILSVCFLEHIVSDIMAPIGLLPNIFLLHCHLANVLD